MKKILLIGDSIRQGYDKSVKHALADRCEVYYPGENSRFAQYIYRHLHEWKDKLGLDDNLDLVHWNVGLWDTLELGEDGCLTPPDHFEFYMHRICKRIKLLFPNAKVIYATSTPVLEHKFDWTVDGRRNSNVRLYNDRAKKIVKQYGFGVNDLYSVVEGVPEEYYSDCTHLYTAEGTQLLTNAVLKPVCEALDMEYKVFTLTDYEQFTEVVGR